MLEDSCFRSDMTIEYVQHSGSDAMVCHAAMVSTGKVRRDQPIPEGKVNGLLNALLSKRHGTPFEHNSVTFFIEAPIFVFREWHRHRVPWGYSEQSARYLDEMPPLFWLPTHDRPLIKDGKKMAPTFIAGTLEQAELTRSSLLAAYEKTWENYQRIIKTGVANEIARAALPVGLYSKMYATSNLRGILNFLSLRTHEPQAKFVSYPQLEIEMCARKVEAIMVELFPETMRIFNANGRVAP